MFLDEPTTGLDVEARRSLVVPVVVIAALFTAATLALPAFLAALGTTILVAIPFTLLGLGIGYSPPAKAAIVVAQVFIPTLVGWTVALTACAVWAYRRDEGRRFS